MRLTLDYPPVWLMGALGIAGVQGHLAPLPLGGVVHGLGTALALGGLALAVWAALEFRRARTTIVPHETPSQLVTSGPYAFSRNPIYLADVLILLGIGLRMEAAPAALILAIVFVKVIEARFILPEEGRIKARFGPAFEAYAARVRRWV